MGVLPVDAAAIPYNPVKISDRSYRVRTTDREDYLFGARINSLEVIAASGISFFEVKSGG